MHKIKHLLAAIVFATVCCPSYAQQMSYITIGTVKPLTIQMSILDFNQRTDTEYVFMFTDETYRYIVDVKSISFKKSELPAFVKAISELMSVHIAKGDMKQIMLPNKAVLGKSGYDGDGMCLYAEYNGYACLTRKAAIKLSDFIEQRILN